MVENPGFVQLCCELEPLLFLFSVTCIKKYIVVEFVIINPIKVNIIKYFVGYANVDSLKLKYNRYENIINKQILLIMQSQ